MKPGRYHIVGAGRGMGRWFAQHLAGRNHTVHGYDIAPDTMSRLTAKVIRCPVDGEHSYLPYKHTFLDGDIVLLAVPQAALGKLKEQLEPVASTSLVVSLTSVQTAPMSMLRQWSLSNPPLGCHPLFGATVRSPVGQLIALTDYQHSQLLHLRFSDHLRDLGLIPTHLSPEDHDRYMGLVQTLPHFSFLVFVRCLAQLSDDPSALFDLRTPNFEFLHAFACRFLKIAPTTTGSIQYAPGARMIRKHFVSAAQELCEMFDAAATIEAASKVISNTREPLPGSHVDEGVQIAQVAVDSIQRFERLLHRHFSTQSPFVFRNRLSGDIHVIRILQNNSTDIKYEEATILYDGQYAVGLDDVSRKNYSRIGLSFGNPLRDTIKKRNIVLLEGDELSLFWKTRVLPLILRMNATNPHGLRETFFEEWLPQLVPGVRSCVFRESFRKRGEEERVTIDITYGARYDKDELINKIRTLVQEFRI
jgi:prephenate dehydrogenase